MPLTLTTTHQSTQEKYFPTTYYILLHKHSILLYMEKFNENKNPRSTIYSIVSTHYYILKLIYEFTLGHAKCDVNPYYGIISVPQITCDQQKHKQNYEYL